MKSKIGGAQWLVRERRRIAIAIAHSLISAVRPRSFISPILLAISVYINTMHESRQLIDILSSLGFVDNYKEVQRLYDPLMPKKEQVYGLSGDLVNFVFDNADVNVRTLTGLDIWHALGGIACVSPSETNSCEMEAVRSTEIRSSVQVGKFAQIPIKAYKKSHVSGLKQCLLGHLEIPKPGILKLAYSLDNIWL